MSQNNPEIVYAGIDVAKASLQLDWNGQSLSLSNDAPGHARLLRTLGRPCGKQVILEASGGYEQSVVGVLRNAGFAVSIVNPARVRWFAKSKGLRAKTDPIDAAAIRQFGEVHHPAATPAPSAEQTRLVALVSRRRQLVDMRTQEANHAEHYADAWIARQSKALRKSLDRQIAACDTAIAALMATHEPMRQRRDRLQQAPGVGPVVAATLQAYLPELGSYSDESIGALVGLAPFTQQSGTWLGIPRIGGGRSNLRSVLYMAAITAARMDPILKAFYQQLLLKGKPTKVAYIAVARKLVVLLNRMVRNPHFVLRTSTSEASPPSPHVRTKFGASLV